MVVNMRIEHEIHIDAEPADVFAVLSDPKRLSDWQPTTVAVRRQRQGPLGLGERFEEVHKGLGRELTSTVEVAAYDAPRLFALRMVSGALPLDGRWELERRGSATRLRFIGEADARGRCVSPSRCSRASSAATTSASRIFSKSPQRRRRRARVVSGDSPRRSGMPRLEACRRSVAHVEIEAGG